MSLELQFVHLRTGKTVYVDIRNVAGYSYNTSSAAFESYLSGNFSNYHVPLNEQGVSRYYVGTFPSGIPAGVYNIVAYEQAGGSPAETDQPVGAGDIQWDGANIIPLSTPQMIADGIVTETGLSLTKTLRLILAAVLAKDSGAVTGQACTVHIRDINDTVDRAVATIDANGNCTSLTFNPN